MLSEEYYKKTKSKYLYNIMPIKNIKNVIKHGILSYNKIKSQKISSFSIADNEVQNRREEVSVPNGLRLHDYANLYMDYWNPMLSRRRNENEEICILCIDLSVLNIDNVVMSDMNASKNLARFYDVKTGIKNIDFEKVFIKSWIVNEEVENKKTLEENNKGIKCAEVLVPNFVDINNIMGLVVCSDNAKAKVNNEISDNLEVRVNSDCFFKGGYHDKI